MHNLTEFLSYTGVNGVIRLTNRFTEHTIDIGVISNGMCQIHEVVKIKYIRLLTSGKQFNTGIFEAI